MRILFFGDVYGRPGRQALIADLPKLKEEWKPDAVIANIENLSHGLGISPSAFDEIANLGIDAFTSGNEIFRRRDGFPLLETKERHILRPANYPARVPGRGTILLEIGLKKLLVVNLLGRTFMTDPVDDPFQTIDRVLSDEGKDADAIIVDFHGEATSEKRAFGFYVDGRVSAMLGTHTHVPTADAQILPKGTGYISDAGFCGPLHSVIGLSPASMVEQFRTRIRQSHEVPEGVESEMGAVFLEVNTKTKHVTTITHIRRVHTS